MKSKDKLNIPEAVFVRAAMARARAMGNRASELAIKDVSLRPAFREPIKSAYAEGWMDAVIHLEEKYYQKKMRSRREEV